MTAESQSETIGFIGLGTMGREMAINLMKAGFRVQAFDVRREAVNEVAALGAQASHSVAAAAKNAAIAITMLPDTPDVESVVHGDGGLLANPPKGRLVIDMSTIAPDAVRRMSAEFESAGVDFLDAPVSGGPGGARNATLSIMVGGTAKAFARAEKVFAGMGTTITHVGGHGDGGGRGCRRTRRRSDAPQCDRGRTRSGAR